MQENEGYELANHLGNVMVVVSDRKLAVDDGTYSGGVKINSTPDGITDFYQADIISAQDYYAGGMLMPGRTFNSTATRYGFNGKEKVDEITGSSGTDYDYGMRMYDARLARFMSVDPITKKYPELSPYQFASNSPIWGIDWDGLELRIYTETKGTGHTFITVQDGDDVIVYTYGRYAGADNATLGTTGQGVLIRYTGEKAKDYIKTELYRMEAKAFQIDDADETKVKEFMDAMYNLPSAETPNTGDADIDTYGKVIDTYNLFGNNCTTKSCNATKAGGSDVFSTNGTEQDFAIPSSLKDFLMNATEENINVTDVTGTMKGTYQNTLSKNALGSAGVSGTVSGSSGSTAGSSANTSSGNSSSSGGNSGSSSTGGSTSSKKTKR